MDTIKTVTDSVFAAVRAEMAIRKTEECFLVFPLGSQFDHLIVMMLTRIGVYVLVCNPATMRAEDVKRLKPKGIILSGGPVSVYLDPPPFDAAIFDLDIPLLGICLGFQLWAQHCGIEVKKAEKREFGVHQLELVELRSTPLLADCPRAFAVLQSHGDVIDPVPELVPFGFTENCPVAVAMHRDRHHLYGVQFHPEVWETEHGEQILENFCFEIAGATQRFPAPDVAAGKVAWLRPRIAGKRVVIALSGGNDSSVSAYLCTEAASEDTELFGVYIKGVDRPDDEARVRRWFDNHRWIKLIVVDATEELLAALKGRITMKEKRRAFKPVYRDVLVRIARKIGAPIVVQGTLYTDISESGRGYDSGATRAQIKEHHNVDLEFPEDIELVEPLKDQVKDTARGIGAAIGVPTELMWSHPFPGPGLVVRVDGEVTLEKLAIARAVDGIYMEELRRWKLYETVWQAGAFVIDVMVPCSKGDDAATGRHVEFWAVWSVNGFTATRARLPEDFWHRLDQRVCNEVAAVGSTGERKTGKPPATIEFG